MFISSDFDFWCVRDPASSAGFAPKGSWTQVRPHPKAGRQQSEPLETCTYFLPKSYIECTTDSRLQPRRSMFEMFRSLWTLSIFVVFAILWTIKFATSFFLVLSNAALCPQGLLDVVYPSGGLSKTKPACPQIT